MNGADHYASHYLKAHATELRALAADPTAVRDHVKQALTRMASSMDDLAARALKSERLDSGADLKERMEALAREFSQSGMLPTSGRIPCEGQPERDFMLDN